MYVHAPILFINTAILFIVYRGVYYWDKFILFFIFYFITHISRPNHFSFHITKSPYHFYPFPQSPHPTSISVFYSPSWFSPFSHKIPVRPFLVPSNDTSWFDIPKNFWYNIVKVEETNPRLIYHWRRLKCL